MNDILSYVEYRQRIVLREADSGSAGDYLVVEDPQKPSTFHLRVRRGGTPDHNLMGAAYAALTSNHRGHAYAGPNASAALSELRALYKSEGMQWPGDEDEE